MSFAKLLRSLGYVMLGALLVVAVALSVAVRDSSNSTAELLAEKPEEQQLESRFEQAEQPSQFQNSTPDSNTRPLAELSSPHSATESKEQPGQSDPPLLRKSLRHVTSNPLPAASEPFAEDPFEGLPITKSGTADRGRLAVDRKLPAASAKPLKFDPRETSWENPFVQEYWEGSGWKFGPQGMNSDGPSSAVFRRYYRRLMLEARLEPLRDVDAPLQLRLQAPASGSMVEISITGSVLEVTEKSPNSDRLREHATLNPPATTGKPGLLRLTATGNRLVLSWNGQIVLSCDQPAAQSGRDLGLEWKSETTPYRISRLRLEGE